MDLGNAIWMARKSRGMTQEQLAEAVDITVSHLKHIESGHRNPSTEVLFSIAKILNLSLDSLIFEESPQISFISTDGLSLDEIGIVTQLVDILRNNRQRSNE